jgi:hypothetical protein
MINKLTATLTATRSTISPSTKIITHGSTPDRDLCGPLRTLRMDLRIRGAAGVHPTKVDKRKLKHVELHHLAWSEVLSTAVLEKEHRGIADPDQGYILGELIRYLERPRSGALEFEDMGPSWVSVRNAVADGTLRHTNPGATEVAGRFDALLRFAALQLSTRLGTDATVVYSRKGSADPTSRIAAHVANMVDHGRLQGSLRIPNTVGTLDLTVDLRARQVVCSVDIHPPKEGRPTTKINWLVRQLKHANERTRTGRLVAEVQYETAGR